MKTTTERFADKVQINDTTACHEWTATINNATGYGNFQHEGCSVTAHRWIYQHVHQIKLTRKQFVCHTCDNRRCVNPNHLFLGSHADNMRDMAEKGHTTPGRKERSLSSSAIVDIRSSRLPKIQMAKKYNVDVQRIYKIINRQLYCDI